MVAPPFMGVDRLKFVAAPLRRRLWTIVAPIIQAIVGNEWRPRSDRMRLDKMKKAKASIGKCLLGVKSADKNWRRPGEC